ncbi:CRISPR-associated protein Cas4 [Entomospira culicis]|uniref:CRISPR-associated exonuclease Cas4 n=1 Tax=Entomospira culicis TaxID=2719989 RepID=A0A968GG13_9SPIO|nr:CRISPR-associated protein Cas4 [Entomospira culicis]NIZ18921.1 CRISPR-associated protein Cas4 [Entomospira culicis]NIZ69136.1 CRISPR-associated protein Cas4 [Entomospira culicis]WDI37722.1 CRISPR-associated protein Cas4 [Entomospira culicis]WDI39350.1 CRISPR-associated protein Cas4 [Entomospira culicis]
MQEYDYIQIASLQHYQYCPRQCALMYNEQIWADSYHTKAGDILHEKTHQERIRYEKGVRIETATTVVSHRYGLMGVCDTIEFHPDTILPIEYKVGKSKSIYEVDKVQLCAQVLCLEEMTGQSITQGAIYYNQEKSRSYIEIDEALRSLTVDVLTNVHKLLFNKELPVVEKSKKCALCSLVELCIPDLTNMAVADYWQTMASEVD